MTRQGTQRRTMQNRTETRRNSTRQARTGYKTEQDLTEGVRNTYYNIFFYCEE